MEHAMKHVAMWLLVAALAGCEGSADPVAGKVQFLGDVDFDTAFITAKGVLAKRYTVEYADQVAGVIRCEPKNTYDNTGRILGGKGQTREVTTLTLRRGSNRLVAVLTVEVQAQGEESERAFSSVGENYSGAPNQTPAQVAGATTPEQNSTWRTIRYAKDVEADILRELHESLYGGIPPGQELPRTQPATGVGSGV